jgi:multidrug transporter EmrE-like cation transporter
MMLVAISGWLAFDERLDGWAIAGIALIVAGVVLISAVSDSVQAGMPTDPGDGGQ